MTSRGDKTAEKAERAAFADAFLLALRPGQARWLRAVVGRGGAVSAAELAACPALRPLLNPDPDDGAGYRLPASVKEQLSRRMDHAARARGPATQVLEAASQGAYDAALRQLQECGGVFISMTEGLEAAQRIADAFPEPVAQANLKLGLLRVVNALKSGDLARADMLMEDVARHFNLPTISECDPRHDPELVCVLFMKAIYADEPVADTAVAQLFATLRDLPPDKSLMRGLLYNVGLDIMMRRNQIATADEAARRALHHYAAAGEAGLGFYIQLYLVVIALWRGDVDRAGDALEAAETALAMFPGHSANDAALLRSLTLIQKYEACGSDALAPYLAGGADNIPFGELWPAMAEPILIYGRLALANRASAVAALSWVQRWRLRQWRSHRFDAIISAQEALALQNLGRWQEADEVLAGIKWADTGELRIARLASALDRAPGSDELALKLKQAIDDPAWSARQRLILILMAAESAAARRNEREAARWLGRALAGQGGGQVARVLAEQRRQLARILSSRALRTELRRLPRLNRSLKEVLNKAAPARPEGLTRQEYRVLLLIAEAQPNKMIAQRLGISLATVKFHVSNLLAKADVRNRKALVEHGLSAGWLDAS